MVNKKLQIWLPLIFSLVLIAGMYFGFKLRENTPNRKGLFRTEKKSSVQEVIDLVKQRYVDSVGTDSLEYDAIQEIVNELDPHSIFIPARKLDEVNEDISGNFEGIGIEFNIFSDTVNVLYVLTDGPSDKAGIQVGDRIIKIDSATVAGTHTGSDDIRKMVRGEGGTNVILTVLRKGQEKQYTVTRGTIPLSAIDAAYMIDKEDGYIKLSKFSDNSYKDFMIALEDLKGKGMKNLVFDLQGNRGGFMNEAVEMADEFLDANKLIVYTEGLNSKRRDYKCRRNGLFEEGKLIILVDETSASASEVLAGALQDWDRATIMGRRTFGKGLVQEQYGLSDGSAVRLTIARYYTPVGRSIQRAYENGQKKMYMDDLFQRYTNGEMVSADSNKITNGKIYQTIIKKRNVYGGGGIMPDVFVPLDTTKLSNAVSQLFFTTSFNNFIYNYYIRYQKEIDSYKTVNDFQKNFSGLKTIWSDISGFASADTIKLGNISQKEKDLVIRRFTAGLARYKWRNSGFYQVLNAEDPVVLKAVETLKN